MAKISKMTVGQRLYETHRIKTGNLKASRDATYDLRIVEIDPEFRWVLASWNSNPPRKYSQMQANRWRVNNPRERRNGK